MDVASGERYYQSPLACLFSFRKTLCSTTVIRSEPQEAHNQSRKSGVPRRQELVLLHGQTASRAAAAPPNFGAGEGTLGCG